MGNTIDISGVRILSVDDNIFDNKMLAVLLNDTGAVIDAVFTADELFTKLENEKYDIILMDQMMPNCDSNSVPAKLRQDHINENTAVIAVAANDTELSHHDYISEGYAACLAKPVERNKLISVIGSCMGKNAAEEKPPHILVVDDNRLNLVLVKKILADSYRVSTALSGAEAFKILEDDIADMILLDLHMPEMDGFEFLRIMNENSALCDIPVICLTADDDRESELTCFELGVMDFISKPFIAEIMHRRIDRILNLKGLQQNLKKEVEKQTLQIKEHSLRFERLTVQTMLTLASAIDAKDKYTNGHSVRVAEYAKMIAEKLALPKQVQNDIYYIGLLHDIGKIGIPDEIINKTSRLTDEEYAVIKTHSEIGSEILKQMSEMPAISLGARWHHERYDGRGYPDGLKGEEIPALARIIGVADAYDAMTSNRSYRNGLSQEVVRNEILKGAGTQFDPKFAEIMLQIIDEDTDYLLREH